VNECNPWYMASGVVARQMLSIADQDQNGKVSREELTGILQVRLYRLSVSKPELKAPTVSAFETIIS